MYRCVAPGQACRYDGVMKYFTVMSACLLLAMPFAAVAGSSQPTHVVELFTSQGCSSCPPANEFIGEVANSPDTLALSYGVTHWDYLGWKDTFADPSFTQRQRAYGKAFESPNVYTPQMVLNGSAHGPRYTAWDVSTMSLPDARPRLDVTVEDEQLLLTVEDLPGGAGPYDLSVVEYVVGPQSVPVTSGENRGRVLTLTNVVTRVHSLGSLTPTEGLNVSTNIKPKPGKAYALFLSDPETMKLQAVANFQP